MEEALWFNNHPACLICVPLVESASWSESNMRRQKTKNLPLLRGPSSFFIRANRQSQRQVFPLRQSQLETLISFYAWGKLRGWKKGRRWIQKSKLWVSSARSSHATSKLRVQGWSSILGWIIRSHLQKHHPSASLWENPQLGALNSFDFFPIKCLWKMITSIGCYVSSKRLKTAKDLKKDHFLNHFRFWRQKSFSVSDFLQIHLKIEERPSKCPCGAEVREMCATCKLG